MSPTYFEEYYYVLFLIFDVQAAVFLPFQVHRLQPPHQDPGTNPVLRVGALSTVPV
ncbi:unnamed protein product [Ascophyllum nodosum]